MSNTLNNMSIYDKEGNTETNTSDHNDAESHNTSQRSPDDEDQKGDYDWINTIEKHIKYEYLNKFEYAGRTIRSDMLESDILTQQISSINTHLDRRTHQTRLSHKWHSQIDRAVTWEGIVETIRSFGLTVIADRLVYLHKLIEDDPDEIPINLKSLQKFALFIMQQQLLPNPLISVSSDGFVHVEWQAGSKGIMIMVFLPSDFVRFVSIYRPSENEDEWNVRGTLPTNRIVDAVKIFVDALVTVD